MNNGWYVRNYVKVPYIYFGYEGFRSGNYRPNAEHPLLVNPV